MKNLAEKNLKKKYAQSKMRKNLLKWGFVLLIIGAVIYTFKDSAGAILEELRETPFFVLVIICASSVCYELMEGWVTYGFAKSYQPAFTLLQGVESAFYCSFYRVATLGSGSGVAAIYYFHEKGIEPSKGAGMYMLEYVLHKVSIAIFSGMFFLLNYRFMREHYTSYFYLLTAGYALTALISAAMVIGGCSKRIHIKVLKLIHFCNRNGKLSHLEYQLGDTFRILEEATTFLLTKFSLVAGTIAKNLVKLAFWYVIPYVTLHEVCGITMSETLAVTAISVLLAAVIPAPAGIGSTEFLFVALYSALVETGIAGSASLLYRFATFVFPFAVGGIVVMIHRLRQYIRKMN